MDTPLIGIVTVSDRASRGDYEDLSGPAVEEALREYLATPCTYERTVVSDDVPRIVEAVRAFVGRGAALVCTTGGTGPAPRDVTPEAMHQVLEKELRGFGERMRSASLQSGVPTAILSRQTAGIVGRTLVVNMPGKPASIRVCLDAVFPAALLAIIGNLLRTRDGFVAGVAGGLVCLVLLPVAPAGVPIILSVAGVVAALWLGRRGAQR